MFLKYIYFSNKYKKIYLVRDRFGIKPLYFSFINGLFLFGSQTKSFYKHPAWKKEISNKSLASFLRYGYIPSNQSIFKETCQVSPGSYIIFSSKGVLKEKRYWNLRNIVENIKKNEFFFCLAMPSRGTHLALGGELPDTFFSNKTTKMSQKTIMKRRLVLKLNLSF